jgi:hypothetical protein
LIRRYAKAVPQREEELHATISSLERSLPA